jgi:hypothetical protein
VASPAAGPATPSARGKVIERYRSDYEVGKLSAERYEGRAVELTDKLLALRSRAAELDPKMEQPVLPGVPDQASLNSLREQLTDQIRNGSVPIRKALFTALVERIEVHEPDDIRPTFRLYDPTTRRPSTSWKVGRRPTPLRKATILKPLACGSQANGLGWWS